MADTQKLKFMMEIAYMERNLEASDEKNRQTMPKGLDKWVSSIFPLDIIITT